MDMVLCDGKHFRAGAKRARRVALFFLDDATRMALHVVVGTSESTSLFLRGIHEVVLKVGLMSILFLDRGPGFIALDSLSVLGNIPIKFIHGTAAYPEGHGKVERFNRTALASVLRGLDGRADVDSSLPALELRLRHFLETQYNHRPHEGINDNTPYLRFSSDPRPLRFPEDRESFRAKFEIFLHRRVSHDNIVSIDSLAYEVPRGYHGKTVLLRKKLLDHGRLFFLHLGDLIELHLVDLARNARSRRAGEEDDDVQHPLPPSAADLAFERDYGPVVDPDGGFPESPHHDHDKDKGGRYAMTTTKDLRSRFGFHSTPFTREIPVSDRLRHPLFDETLDALARMIEERMSAVLIAPAGTGKTALLRALIEERLPAARFRVHYVKVNDLSKRDMCREIAFAVGTSPAGSYPVLVRRLQERFQETSDTDGLRPVLLLDDAHDLRVNVLSLLRILTNFDMDSRLVLSMVLSGQPPLAQILRQEALEDVARRIAHYATLRPLSRKETLDYVRHRSTVAGASNAPFDDRSLEAIYEIGRGNMRATDHLALKTLEVAHKEDADVADSNHVASARKLLWP